MDLGDAGTQAKFVLHDRDASFTQAFDAVFQAAGIRIIRSGVQAPRMNSITERWIDSCRRELLDRTLIWNQRHLMLVLREYEDFYNSHRPHRALDQAAPLRPLPYGITDLDHFRVRRHDRVLTARTEVTDRMLIFGERHLRTILAGYEAHYNGRRPHRSGQLRPPRPDHPVADLSHQRIKRRLVLGGLINEHERAA